MAERAKGVSGRRLVRVLESFGWHVERVKGSHHIMRHPEQPRTTLSVPVHGNDILPIGTLMSILGDADISVVDFNREA